MFKKEVSEDDKKLDAAIDRVLHEMENTNGDSEEYSRLTDQLSKLYKIKREDPKDRVSKDTLAVVAGNLLGIVVIVNHERLNVITTKALNFVLKTK